MSALATSHKSSAHGCRVGGNSGEAGGLAQARSLQDELERQYGALGGWHLNSCSLRLRYYFSIAPQIPSIAVRGISGEHWSVNSKG